MKAIEDIKLQLSALSPNEIDLLRRFTEAGSAAFSVEHAEWRCWSVASRRAVWTLSGAGVLVARSSQGEWVLALTTAGERWLVALGEGALG